MSKSDLPNVDVYRRFANRDVIDLIAQAYGSRVGDYINPPETYSYYATAVVAANQLYAHFMLLQRRMRFDRIAIYVGVGGAGGAAARLGIYNVDWRDIAPTYYPTNLILDAGVVDCTVVGNRDITIDETLDKGWYALAFVCNDATIQVRYRQYALSPLGYVDASYVVQHGWDVAQAYGALPDPYTVGGASHGIKRMGLRLAELL